MAFTRKTQPAPVKPAPTPEEVVAPIMVPTAVLTTPVQKGPLDCPVCNQKINHAGPHL